MPLNVKLQMGSPTFVMSICESKGTVLICQERATYFPFVIISDTEDAFSEGFETGTLRTSDWGYCQLFQTPVKEDAYVTTHWYSPSKDTTTPIRDTGHLEVVCDENSMP